ncbi:MAG: hypothetical protein U5R14_00600 [Gemmatimonadota bacterium]|nr:hypothetical protein [Gemmatimonadota bacterium]
MTTRIHIVLDPEDKARYRAQAEREGKSLAAWLREAAEDRLRGARDRKSLRSREALEAFFDACDEGETEREPDWDEHRALIERSRVRGLDPT